MRRLVDDVGQVSQRRTLFDEKDSMTKCIFFVELIVFNVSGEFRLIRLFSIDEFIDPAKATKIW